MRFAAVRPQDQAAELQRLTGDRRMAGDRRPARAVEHGEECPLGRERGARVGMIDGRDEVAHPRIRRARFDRDRSLAGRWEKEIAQVQLLGRLLSTRHETTQLREGSRLLVPVSFRDFLGVHPEPIDENDKNTKKGKPVMVIGAAVCIEIWNPPEWLKYQQGRMPKFRRLVQKLS